MRPIRYGEGNGLIISSVGAIILRRNPLGLCAFLGLMPAHETTCCCAYDAVVAGIVAGNASNDSALEATLGCGGRSQSGQQQGNECES